MTFKTYEINVDLVNDTSTTSANHFSQNDRNSAKLLITITNKGAELDLSQAKSVRMSFKKPDGTRVFQNDCQPINVLKGKYQILLKTQTLTSIGNVIAQIHIEEEDRVIDTQKFFFVVNDSLASDESIESTNEFTIIAKALELGEKFKNVDFDPIIAAGELAKGAVKKAGDTMTGTLVIDNADMLVFKGGTTGREWKIARDQANKSLLLVPQKETKDGWDWAKQIEFRPDSFIVNGGTNLLKKTGDTVTGTLNVNAPFFINSKDGKKQFSFETDANGKFWFSDKNTPRDVFTVEDDGTFRVAGATNLVKKAGDTMTGDLAINTANKGFKVSNGTEGISHLVDTQGVYYWYASSSKIPLRYDVKTDTLNVTVANTNIVTKTKDDRANITVTADAELITSYGVIADRRGNTVTLRAPIRRKVGSTGGHVFTLPVSMRPTMMLTQVVHASDGTPALMTIPSDTGQVLLQTITPLITGKDYHIVLTYVAD